LEVSVVGLGTEHLSRDNVGPVVRAAVDGGVNYIDLLVGPSAEDRDAYGAALTGIRDKVFMAGHLGIAETDGQYRKSRDVEECEMLFHDLLARLRTDHVDVLHLHNVDEPDDYEQIVESGGVLELAQRLKREGKTRAISLSGHAPPTATRAVESGYLDVLMHPINLAWDAYEGRNKVYHLCVNRGVGLVAMKTFAGGEIFQRDKPISPVKCISYTLSQPGVSTVVVGVKNVDELEAALAFLDATDAEKDYVPVLGDFQKDLEGTCVYCNHCLPCPSRIDVGATLRLLVTARQHGISEQLREAYGALPAVASDCIACGDCMARCPFDVDVIAKMEEAVDILEAS
jgi:predicted aldo/keto reductase-like oxidoreductase